MTVSRSIELLLDEAAKENSVTSQHVRRWMAQGALKAWGADRDLGTITRREVQGWVTQRRQDVAPSTLASELSFFRRLYRCAWDAGYDVLCPAQDIRLPKINNKRERVLSPEEEAELRGVMAQEEWSMVEFALQTGIRRLEQFRLKPSDCRFFTREIDGQHLELGLAHITDSKTGKGRKAALNPVAVAVVKQWMARESGRYVFWSKRPGERHHITNRAYDMLQAACKKVGIVDLHWHDLRHSCATRAADNGATAREIQALLGHQTVQMSERYINSTSDGPLFRAALAVCR